MATTQGWGEIPFQFYDMLTRIMILVAIAGLVLIWFGTTEESKTIALLGIVITLIGFLGSHLSLRNKKSFRFLRRL